MLFEGGPGYLHTLTPSRAESRFGKVEGYRKGDDDRYRNCLGVKLVAWCITTIQHDAPGTAGVALQPRPCF